MEIIIGTRCHTCGAFSRDSQQDRDKAGWLDPHYIDQGNSTVITALCPDCVPDSGLPAIRRWALQSGIRLGPISKKISYLSSCQRCETTWDFVRGHSTMYVDGRGCFPLCEQCWAELTPEERVPFYRALYVSWLRHYPEPEETWFSMQEAVLRGL